MADEKQAKTLEMRVAELEDKLAKIHVTEDEIKAYHKVSSLMGGAAPAPSCIAAAASSCVAAGAAGGSSACVAAGAPSPTSITANPCVVQSCVVRPTCIAQCVVQSCIIRPVCIVQACECLQGGGGGVGGGGFGSFGA